MAKKNHPNTEQNISRMSMGTWKINSGKLKWKDGKAAPKSPSRTRPPGAVKYYFAKPPIDGWPGGDPEANGYRKRTSK